MNDSLPQAAHRVAGTTQARVLIAGPQVEGQGRPRLSIAIPTYKRFDLLSEAISSVLAQRFSIPIELLVVDNDPDNDAEALAAMQAFAGQPLTYYKNLTNVGMVANWNCCMALARGDYVTILHDDDLLEPAFAEEVSRHLGPGGSVGDAIAWRHGVLDERAQRPLAAAPSKGRPVKQAVKRLLAPLRSQVKRHSVYHLFFANPFAGTLGIVLRRDQALALGGFDPGQHPIADYDFWCRWTAAYAPLPIWARPVSLYRMRQNESMLPQTRAAFVTGSRQLRERMIATGAVPRFYRHLLDPLQRTQQTSIEEDWREMGQAPMSRMVSLKLRVWRWFTGLLTAVQARRSRSSDRGSLSS
ncbi:glycosyltransferase family 2 protein [Roseateles terrae]|uniref:Glycosyltransferase involved in cell wall biosynthesis n=1 Tax=Roseateles terrae TaxID=431060 RepID=A0ABR6GTX9_9BURK|nr:glycosyltransferase family 2 protein [Roseateles terrae]MBB3195166.1 glycosyltransferase involved in cell wall biosynthesis [Roseateles terrae]OWQ87186.1 hypothetical protein CDN98_10080 [Roseateles terrae]